MPPGVAAAAALGLTAPVYAHMPYGGLQSGQVHGKLSVPASSADAVAMGIPIPPGGLGPGPTTPLPLHAQLAASRSDLPLQMQQPGAQGFMANNNQMMQMPPLSSYYQPMHQYSHSYSRPENVYANRMDAANEISFRFPSQEADNAHSRAGQQPNANPQFQPDAQQKWGVRAARLPITLRSLTPMPVLHSIGAAPNPKRPSSAGVPRDPEDERDAEGLHEKGRCSPVDEVADPDAESDDEFSPARRLQSFTNLREASASNGGGNTIKRSYKNLHEGPPSAHDTARSRNTSSKEDLGRVSSANAKDASGKPLSNNLRQGLERELDASTVKRLIAQQKHMGSTIV